MQFLFILVSLAGAAYFLTKHRRFDGAALAFFSAVVYFSPGYFGNVPYASRGFWMDPMHPLQGETYGVMCAVLGAILASTIVKDHLVLPERRTLSFRGMEFLSSVLLALSLFGFVLTLETTGWDTLASSDKGLILENLNRWFTLWSVAATLATVVAFVQRRWWHLAISLVLLALVGFTGFRAEIVVASMAIGLIVLEGRGAQRLFTRTWKWVAPTVLVMIALALLFPMISLGMKMDEPGFIADRMLDPDTYYFSIVYSEPFYVQSTLNEVLDNNFTVGLDHFSTLFMLALPFAPEWGLQPVSFNDLFQPALFPHANGGLANNIWAEMWSSGGWFLLAPFILIFALLVHVGDAFLHRTAAELKAVVAVCLAYWGFYIHRNDIVFELVLIRNVLIVFFIAAVLAKFLSMLRPRVPHAATRGLG